MQFNPGNTVKTIAGDIGTFMCLNPLNNSLAIVKLPIGIVEIGIEYLSLVTEIKKKQKKIYTVWYNQVNQGLFEICAKNKEDAQRKAEREIKKYYPAISSIKEDV